MLVPARADAWDALLASNRILRPDDTMDLADEPPVDYGLDASSVLQSMRDQDR
jgi:hypothetical protein